MLAIVSILSRCCPFRPSNSVRIGHRMMYSSRRYQRFKLHLCLDKSDKSLISEEAFTVKNIVGTIDFQEIADRFDAKE